MALLYIVSIVLGVGETLFESATQGLLPQVVPEEQLGDANGQLYMSTIVGSSFVGPSVGSWLFSVGRLLPFIVDTVTFLASAALLMVHRIRQGSGSNSVPPAAQQRNLLGEVGEGFGWIRKHKLIRTFLAVVTVVNFTQSAAQSLLVLLAVGKLGLSPWAYGLLLSVSGIGAFLGGMLSGQVGTRFGIQRVLLPAIAASVPLMLVMAWTKQPFVLGLAFAINAFLGVLAAVQMASLRQRIVPNHLLGRVSSVGQFSSYGIAIPLGALTAGLIAEWLSVSAVYVFAALTVVVLLVVVGNDLKPTKIQRELDLMMDK